MRKYFGTDGIRGKVNEKLTPQLALSLGISIGKVLSEINSNSRRILIGRDTRNSGLMIEQAISSGLLAQGFDVLSLGVVPTPAVAFLTKYYKADLGVVISASHNPFFDNGIKFFNHEGRKLDDSLEERIEVYLDSGVEALNQVENIGRYEVSTEAVANYLDYLTQLANSNDNKKKIVLDTANGALSQFAEAFFKKLGYEVIAIGNEPNGININLNCGSTHLNLLKKTVLDKGADLGFAFDGDADRFLAIDEKGEILDGDELLFLYARYLKKINKLINDKVVATVMSNLGLSKALEKYNISLIETKVGDRYVSEGMKTHRANLGGEQSGHLIFSDYNTTGDGLLSAIMLLNVLSSEGLSLNEVKHEFNKYPQTLVNVKVNDKANWESNELIKKIIQEKSLKLAGSGRILVRASGTENLIRVMVEGEELETITEIAEKIADVIRDELK